MTVHSADGTALHAEVVGSDELPTLVLSHGWTEGIRYWSLMIGELASELRFYRLIELPETGHMGPLERPAEVADALRELAKATDPPPSPAI